MRGGGRLISVAVRLGCEGTQYIFVDGIVENRHEGNLRCVRPTWECLIVDWILSFFSACKEVSYCCVWCPGNVRYTAAMYP